jgi:FkbM family methyltransferase
MGLSDSDGERSFFVPSDAPGDSVAGMIYDKGDQTVPVMSLDTYCTENGIAHIDVLKVDVQGHEPAVLRGAERMLSEGRIDVDVSASSADYVKEPDGARRNSACAPDQSACD